jgi:hypothetical protein
MNRFLVLFGIMLVISIGMIATATMQADFSLLDSKATPLWLAAVAVAAYVAWRIDGVLKRRERRQDASANGGRSFLKAKVSPSQSARASRVAARRKKLIAEGKLEAGPDPEAKSEAEKEAPSTRVSQAAPIKDRMAARAERVRQAKEQGKL